MEAFKEFDKPYILTGGGPGIATEVIDMYTYRQAFVSFNFSKAAAICMVLFIILLICGMLYGKFVLERNQNEL
jgi:multiple sugar transport system permease protein